MVNRLIAGFTLCMLIACGSEESASNENSPADQAPEDVMEDHTTTMTPVLFEDVYSQSGNLESRQEMIEILGLIGTYEGSGNGYEFKNVEKTPEGYSRTCEYDYNGSLNFLFSGGDELEEFYNSYEPVLEHNGQDLFPYSIDEVFVNAPDKSLNIELRFLEIDNNTGIYSTDMSYDPSHLEISEEVDYGPVIAFNNRYYIRFDFYESLPERECEPYEP